MGWGYTSTMTSTYREQAPALKTSRLSVPPLREEAQFAAEPGAARSARALAALLCARASLPPDVRDAAVLLASELVSNAVVHAKTPVRLTVLADPTHIRVEVADEADQLPILKEPSESTGGRGIYLVNKCATRWGVDSVAHGKVVWFEVRAA